MRVVHVSPMYFGDQSVVGGAERYTVELARAMAKVAPTTLVSFGTRREGFELDRLRVEIFPAHHLHGRKDSPVSLRFLSALAGAEVVHCHQAGTSTALALLVGRPLRRACFVTPLGLSPGRTEHRLIRIMGFSALLCISAYSAKHWWYPVRTKVIHGGVDTQRFRPSTARKERKIVCVARLVPHKGINYLIEAIDEVMRLEVYGRPYHEQYYRDLQLLARGKDVHFYTDASDDDIARAYASALVSVLPSVEVDMYGAHWGQPELLGLVLLEAMASGTAVVGSAVGAIPEYIVEGVTGHVVPPGDTRALAAVLRRLYHDTDYAERLGHNGCDLVRERFTWDAVARSCLEAYGSCTLR